MERFVYGVHSVWSLLQCNPQNVLEVFFLRHHRSRRLVRLRREFRRVVRMTEVRKHWLERTTRRAAHQNVVARVRRAASSASPHDLEEIVRRRARSLLLLLLDGVTDVRNLGACMRVADAAGVHAVVVPRRRSAPLNAAAKKTASGGAESIPFVRVPSLSKVLRLLKRSGVEVVGTAHDAPCGLYGVSLRRPLAWLMGSEHNGVRRLLRARCDTLVRIPMWGASSSLNVSVATGIVLFETVRQRRFDAAV